jgi:hypothetical protein
LALLGSLILLGFSMAVVGGIASQKISLQDALDQLHKLSETSNPSEPNQHP